MREKEEHHLPIAFRALLGRTAVPVERQSSAIARHLTTVQRARRKSSRARLGHTGEETYASH